MLEKIALPEEARLVCAMLDEAQYPETCAALVDEFIESNPPYDLASRLMECDRPKEFPAFVIEYITALYEIEISEGNAYAMNDLGAHYYVGARGFEQSFRKAMELYHMAAEHGNRQAQENLGYCYYYGRDTDVDYAKAFHYFALGAFDGHLISLYKIGDMYRNGYYVEKNEREAFLIYKHCIQVLHGKGDDYLVSGPVRLRLGDMYLNGIGTDVNAEAALASYGIAELDLYRMVKDGHTMYKNSLRAAIRGQAQARELLAAELPEGEWTFDD